MKDKGRPLRVRVEFGGAAADAIRTLHASGLHGPTMELVVEGLTLATAESHG